MKKLNYLGIGPKIGGPSIPLLALLIFVTMKYRSTFSISSGESKVFLWLGIIMIAAGLILYFLTLPLLLKGLKETKLITYGAYSLCRNPLYAAFIIFLVPGVALVLNSWLLLIVPIIAYILFKISIKSECGEMEEFFGEEYIKYKSVTPELFPFPYKKWFR